MSEHDSDVQLRIGETVVADYVVSPEVEPMLSPRPYLHPVRTLDGVVVTDALPADHRWHLGASLAVQDVSGTNLWGGRTYVRDTGYTWREDHGQIIHVEFVKRTDDLLVQRLRWCDREGATLLDEERRLHARPLLARPDSWVLEVGYALTAPPDRAITLGSPATNGRPGGTGYGGFFWRAALSSKPPRVFTASASGENAVNGATEPWVAMVSPVPNPYTLIFVGLAPGQHWFVRSSMYPGVCAAFAFTEPKVIEPGETYAGRHQVLVADAVLSQRTARRLAEMVQEDDG
ncbi:MAG TPA: PmoA family protein [Natronosporangium sp.]